MAFRLLPPHYLLLLHIYTLSHTHFTLNLMNILLIIDPQNDFITGSLAVPGAVGAMDYLTAYLQELTTVASRRMEAFGRYTAFASLSELLSIRPWLM